MEFFTTREYKPKKSYHFDNMWRYLEEGKVELLYDYIWTYNLTPQSLGEALFTRDYFQYDEYDELIKPVLEYIKEISDGLH